MAFVKSLLLNLKGMLGIAKPNGKEEAISIVPPYVTKPMTVANDGSPISSIIPLTLVGMATLPASPMYVSRHQLFQPSGSTPVITTPDGI